VTSSLDFAIELPSYKNDSCNRNGEDALI